LALDPRWKNPQGKNPEQLWRWAQDLITELRKGDYLPAAISDAADVDYDNATSGLSADNVQGAIDEVEGRVDALEALSDAGLVLLNSGTISSSQSTLDIELPPGYRAYKLMLDSFLPATNDVSMLLRFSTNGGSTFVATGYRYAGRGIDHNAISNDAVSSSATGIAISGLNGVAGGGLTNVASETGLHSEVVIYRPAATGQYTRVRYDSVYNIADNRVGRISGGGDLPTAQDTDAIRVIPSSGNIASGSWALYGYA
jgi:hypothetical protein